MRLLILLGLALAGCGDQPPGKVSEIFNAVKSRIDYSPYAAYDYVYVPPGKHEAGNCAKFAYTAWVELHNAGLPVVMVSCTTEDTHERHVYARTGDWALDVRFLAPVKVDEVKCI